MVSLNERDSGLTRDDFCVAATLAARWKIASASPCGGLAASSTSSHQSPGTFDLTILVHLCDSTKDVATQLGPPDCIDIAVASSPACCSCSPRDPKSVRYSA